MNQILEFSHLVSITQTLHDQMRMIFYALLVPGFALALVFNYFKQPWGSPEILDSVKRLCIAILLLVAFPEMTAAIVSISQGIANLIDDHAGLESILDSAKKATQSIRANKGILLSPQLFISILCYLSYGLVYLAFFFIIALRQFLWALLIILAPILIFFVLFPSTSNITKNLFRSLIELSSWDILWRILGMMLKSLRLTDYYAWDDYFTIIILNFVVAIAMLGTPFVTKSIIGSGLASLGSTIQTATVGAVMTFPTKIGAVYAVGKRGAQFTSHIAKRSAERMQPVVSRMRRISSANLNAAGRKS